MIRGVRISVDFILEKLGNGETDGSMVRVVPARN